MEKIIIIGTVLPAKIRGQQSGVIVNGLRAVDIPELGPCVVVEARLLAPIDGCEFVDVIFRSADFVRAAASGGEFQLFKVPMPGDLVRLEVSKERLKWRSYGQFRKASAIINSPTGVEIRRQSRETVNEILGGSEPPTPTPTPTKKKKRV